MEMTPQEYQKYVQSMAKKSPIVKDVLLAFVIGGAICVLGQLILNGWTMTGLSADLAGTAASMTMVFLGALLTGVGIYDRMAKRAGAGTIVPITGFANSVVSPAMEFRTEGFVMGMSAKMFTIAGPVLVYGLSASVIYGVVYYVGRLL